MRIRGIWTQVKLKSKCPVASSLTQNAAATSLAPPRGIWFLETHVFARGYYKGGKNVPRRWTSGREETGHLEHRTAMPSSFSYLIHKAICRNEDTFTEAGCGRGVHSFPTLGASEQLNSSSFVQVKDSDRLILKTWRGRWGLGPSWQGASGAEVTMPRALHSQRHTQCLTSPLLAETFPKSHLKTPYVSLKT